jgi:heptaprenyl diphosphate synthase
MGKPVGSDLVSGIVTLPVIYALNQPKAQAALRVCLADSSSTEKAMPQVMDIIRENGGIEYSLDVAESLVRRAKSVLPVSAHTDVREALLNLADMVVHRSF